MFGLTLCQVLYLLKIRVKIAIRAVFQAKDYIVFGLKGIEEIDEVLMLDSEENVLLVLKHLYLLGCCYCVFSDELQSTVLHV